jgi:predicted O-linked N-acetylglucosamine transferase (SPINDLY family)
MQPQEPQSLAQLLQAAEAHLDAGQLPEAESLYRQILARDPSHADALHYLGLLACQVGRLDAAEELIRRSIAVRPNTADPHNNLGETLRSLGRFDEAINCYRRAIELDSHYPQAFYNLGIALQQSGRLEEAIDSYRRATALRPGYATAWCNLGHCLEQLGRLDEALASCQASVSADPDLAAAHNNLGAILKRRGRLTDAIRSFERALAIDPQTADARNNLGQALEELGHGRQAIATFREVIRSHPEAAYAHSNLLVSMLYQPGVSEPENYAEARRWDELHAAPLARLVHSHANDRAARRTLRVGYVSPDFHAHPVAFFLEGLLDGHRRPDAEIEVFCYATSNEVDEVTLRLQRHADAWRNIACMSDDAAAELMREDRIDVLVDLSGHSGRHRLPLFARKPAPVQMTYLGYPATTGLNAMGYRLTDVHADPDGSGSDAFYAERLVRLPKTFVSFRPAPSPPAVATLPADANGHVTFASFHKLAKLNDDVLATWAAVLRRVPRSRVTLVAGALVEPVARQRLIVVFARLGITAGRVEFLPSRSFDAYLRLHDSVDVVLDAFPWTGHTVACHAAWMGVPTVTLTGTTHRSRMVHSLLMNLGLPELIGMTTDAYVDTAVALAKDARRLRTLRSTLRDRLANSALMNHQEFAHDMEAAYRTMWQTWCDSAS